MKALKFKLNEHDGFQSQIGYEFIEILEKYIYRVKKSTCKDVNGNEITEYSYRYMLTLKTTDEEGKNGILVIDENDLSEELHYDLYVLVEE